MEQEKNWYRVLEIGENASEQEIKAAYRRLAKKYHPDTHENDKSCAEKFNDITGAYQILSDSEKRKEYDRRREHQKEGRRSKQKASPDREDITELNFNNVQKNFESFFGFNPDTREVIKEDKVRMKKNPLDTSDFFERFMGIKR